MVMGRGSRTSRLSHFQDPAVGIKYSPTVQRTNACNLVLDTSSEVVRVPVRMARAESEERGAGEHRERPRPAGAGAQHRDDDDVSMAHGCGVIDVDIGLVGAGVGIRWDLRIDPSCLALACSGSLLRLPCRAASWIGYRRRQRPCGRGRPAARTYR
eukprot:scaffold31270_cov51-Phaeocystis_antarctica.AAC.1